MIHILNSIIPEYKTIADIWPTLDDYDRDHKRIKETPELRTLEESIMIALLQYDYTYEFSDDIRAFHHGSQQAQNIKELINQLDDGDVKDAFSRFEKYDVYQDICQTKFGLKMSYLVYGMSVEDRMASYEGISLEDQKQNKDALEKYIKQIHHDLSEQVTVRQRLLESNKHMDARALHQSVYKYKGDWSRQILVGHISESNRSGYPIATPKSVVQHVDALIDHIKTLLDRYGYDMAIYLLESHTVGFNIGEVSYMENAYERTLNGKRVKQNILYFKMRPTNHYQNDFYIAFDYDK